MASWTVLVPITGYIPVSVEADSEKEAIEAAFESEELNLDNVGEWEAHKAIVQGNVFHGSRNEAEAILEDEG